MELNPDLIERAREKDIVVAEGEAEDDSIRLMLHKPSQWVKVFLNDKNKPSEKDKFDSSKEARNRFIELVEKYNLEITKNKEDKSSSRKSWR